LVLIINSCNESRDIKYLSGYWEISSVSVSGKELKNYPFSGTIDYFILDEKNNGYRKKVKPRLDGNFDITMHEIQFKINKQKNDIYLVYGKGENFKEKLVKLDSMKLILRNTDGLIYKYKRFYPKNFLNE
tara:strand:- start:92 stop:481 length:390 start_codon:yes stop_codon:yes gene_type:complete